MKDSKSKIRLTYLYRDAGNYKQFGQFIFSNVNNTPLSELRKTITFNLIDSEFFDPRFCGIPLINSFPYDHDLDHSWYEFENIEEVDINSECDIDINEFINSLKSQHLQAF